MNYFKKVLSGLKDASQKNKLLILAYRYNKFAEAEGLLNESISIDTWELESLVNSARFEFSAPKMDEVIVENISEMD